jgi:hypothetical protein
MYSHTDIARKFRYRLTAELHLIASNLYSDEANYGASAEIQETLKTYEKCFLDFYKHYVPANTTSKKTPDGMPINESGTVIGQH